MRKLLPIILIAAALGAGAYVGYILGVGKTEVEGPTLSVTFLDAQRGNGIVVRTPEGSFVVIDPGPASSADELVEHLRQAGAKSISVVVSSPSADRGGALGSLVESVGVSNVYRGELKGGSSAWRRSVESVRDSKIPASVVSGGSVVKLSPSTKLEVLSPPKGMLDDTSSDWDNNSLVTRIWYGDKRFLFMSDTRIGAEGHLIQSGNDLVSDVVNVGRNGRSGSTSLELLCVVRPEMCVVSVGRRRRKPGKTVLTRIDTNNTGAAVYRTDKDGTIRIVTDGRSIVVDTEGTGRD